MPGTQEALTEAAKDGYEAVVLVVILLGFLGVFAFIVKWFIVTMDKRLLQADVREERLAARVTELEKFVESVLMKMIADCSTALVNNTTAVSQLIGTLNERPCFFDSGQQTVIVDRLATQLKAKI